MERFWAKRMPQFTEEDTYEYIKDILRKFDEEDDYQRGGGSSSSGRGNTSSNRRGGGSSSSNSSYHESKEAKLEKLAEVYQSICDFFDEIGIDPKSMLQQQGQYRR